MDEPEISFVSYKTNSPPSSPKPSNSQSEYTLNSNQTSNYSSMSLIQFQQKQLCKQFNNISPIDEPNSLTSQLKGYKSFSTTIPFETTSSYYNSNSFTNSKTIHQEEQENTLKCTSLIEGPLDDEDDDTSSLIEGRLTVPFDFTTVSQFRSNLNNKTGEKQTFQTNQFTNVSSLNSSDRKSDSLISFEHHELSQMTPLQTQKMGNSKIETSISRPVNHFDDYDGDEHQSDIDSTILSFKQLTTLSNSNQHSPVCNSTPMVSLNGYSRTMTNQADTSHFQNFLDTSNQTSSLIYFNESANSSMVSFRNYFKQNLVRLFIFRRLSFIK